MSPHENVAGQCVPTDSLARVTTTRAAGVPSPALTWMKRIGSLKLTLLFLLALGGSVLASYWSAASGSWPIAIPLALLAVNLIAAILSNTAFRRQTALLVFHLALLAIVLLAAAGRMTYLKGELELSTGESFDGTLTRPEQGPWHVSRLERASFVNEGFNIAYSPGVRRDETRNRVSWRDASGTRNTSTIGDQQALVLEGYRFYTSFNKGFAPIFTWRPTRGPATRGTIHLPSYPIHEHGQAIEWTLPGTDTKLWVMLQFDEVLLDPTAPTQFKLPSRHTLVVRQGDNRVELTPRTVYATPHGVLVYEGLTSWMGYSVFYDWTMPWLLAACVLAVAALGWHFWRKFTLRPWTA
jgi:hypothetical protein